MHDKHWSDVCPWQANRPGGIHLYETGWACKLLGSWGATHGKPHAEKREYRFDSTTFLVLEGPNTIGTHAEVIKLLAGRDISGQKWLDSQKSWRCVFATSFLSNCGRVFRKRTSVPRFTLGNEFPTAWFFIITPPSIEEA